MRSRSVALGVFALFAAVMGRENELAGAAPARADHFALVLERSAKGWKAHCDTGCLWSDVSMTCDGCDVQLDASGITLARSGTRSASGFVFVLSSAGRGGWTARGVRGVNWRSLSWSCSRESCQARVDEAGVRDTQGLH